MLKGAILFFAFSIFLFGCATKITVLPSLPPAPSQPMPPSESTIPEVSLIEKEVEKKEKQELLSPPITSPPPSAPVPPVASLLLPDIAITNIFLDKKRRLVATLANIGRGPFPMKNGNLMVYIDGQLKKSFPLSNVSQESFLQSDESLNFTTSLTIFGRHEINARIDTDVEMRELNIENNHFKKILEGLPIGPDIVVKDLDLTEDLELYIILSNAGEADLRKGVTFRFKIFVNDRKISEFEHFISEVLKAHSGNHYKIAPPYRVGIGGISKVKISISPRLRSDDVRLENNLLERKFVIFPFTLVSQGKEEFSFSVLTPHPKDENREEKMKVEVRWDGGGYPLMLSFKGTGFTQSFPTLTGKSPLKIEFPIHLKKDQEENLWRVSVTNLIDKKVEGHLIIQHP